MRKERIRQSLPAVSLAGSDGRSQKTEDGRRRSEDGGRRTEAGRRRTEDGGKGWM